MRGQRLVFGLSTFTAVGLILYWLLVFLGLFPVEEVIPGYKDWFMAFPIADLWIAVNAFVLSFALLQKKVKWAIVTGLLSASGMIFLALNALLYGINTGLLFQFSLNEIIEIAVKVYCLSVGSYFIVYFSKRLKDL